MGNETKIDFHGLPLKALKDFIATPEGAPLMGSLTAGATFLRIVTEACYVARTQGLAATETKWPSVDKATPTVEYVVDWEIHVGASDPETAARMA